MMRKFLYHGDIMPLFKQRQNGGRVYDSFSHLRDGLENIFESQLMGRKFKGNISIESWLFLPFPEGMGKIRQKEKDNHYYRSAPTLAIMLRALETVCGDLLFEKDTAIVAMSMEKRWSMDPRLEMVISELSAHGKKAENKEECSGQREDR